MTLRTLNYGNYGIFLIMGNAGFCPSTVRGPFRVPEGAPFTIEGLRGVLACCGLRIEGSGAVCGFARKNNWPLPLVHTYGFNIASIRFRCMVEG